jgi:hypothetical protein
LFDAKFKSCTNYPDLTEGSVVVSAIIEAVWSEEVVTVEPEPTYEFDRYNADPAGYVCTPIPRELSCLDDGRPVYVDSNMGQLGFGVKP